MIGTYLTRVLHIPAIVLDFPVWGPCSNPFHVHRVRKLTDLGVSTVCVTWGTPEKNVSMVRHNPYTALYNA